MQVLACKPDLLRRRHRRPDTAVSGRRCKRRVRERIARWEDLAYGQFSHNVTILSTAGRFTGSEHPKRGASSLAAVIVQRDLGPGEWSVLALLADAPAHGWALSKQMSRTGEVGRVWSMGRPLVYRALDEPWKDGSIHELRINTKGTQS